MPVGSASQHHRATDLDGDGEARFDEAGTASVRSLCFQLVGRPPPARRWWVAIPHVINVIRMALAPTQRKLHPHLVKKVQLPAASGRLASKWRWGPDFEAWSYNLQAVVDATTGRQRCQASPAYPLDIKVPDPKPRPGMMMSRYTSVERPERYGNLDPPW